MFELKFWIAKVYGLYLEISFSTYTHTCTTVKRTVQARFEIDLKYHSFLSKYEYELGTKSVS